jgi:hypothetical protein
MMKILQKNLPLLENTKMKMAVVRKIVQMQNFQVHGNNSITNWIFAA